MSSFIRNSFHKKLNNLFLAQCNYIISVSENCRTDLIGIYPRASRISETITIGTYEYNEIVPIRKFSDQPIFINVGSFVPEKNHSFLIEIFTNFRNKTGVGQLWLVGDGRFKDQLNEKITRLGLEAHVKFWGFRKDVLSILKAADLMIMPSKIEGLPGVILEALSCGVPVIASDVGGISEVIKNDLNGYCIKNFETDEYVRRINNLLDAPVLYKKLCLQGQHLIRDKFLMDQIAEKFSKAYQRVIEKRC